MSSRGSSKAREPGTHEHRRCDFFEARVHGFRVRRSAAPRNDGSPSVRAPRAALIARRRLVRVPWAGAGATRLAAELDRRPLRQEGFSFLAPPSRGFPPPPLPPLRFCLPLLLP